MLTVSEDADNLQKCFELGAYGYILKNTDTDFLVAAIRQVVAGQQTVSPELPARPFRHHRFPHPERARCVALRSWWYQQQNDCLADVFIRKHGEGVYADYLPQTKHRQLRMCCRVCPRIGLG